MAELLSPKDVSAQLGVSRQWVTELIRRRELKAERVGDRWVITQEAVNDYLKKRRQEPD